MTSTLLTAAVVAVAASGASTSSVHQIAAHGFNLQVAMTTRRSERHVTAFVVRRVNQSMVVATRLPRIG